MLLFVSLLIPTEVTIIFHLGCLLLCHHSSCLPTTYSPLSNLSDFLKNIIMSLLCFKLFSNFSWLLNKSKLLSLADFTSWCLPTSPFPHAPHRFHLLTSSQLTALLPAPQICQPCSYLWSCTLAVCSFCLECYFPESLWLIQFSAPHLLWSPTHPVLYLIVLFYILPSTYHPQKLHVYMYYIE